MLVNRDPFARSELHKRQIRNPQLGWSCAWCGTVHRRLYVYWHESDGGRKGPESKPFCSISCLRSYET